MERVKEREREREGVGEKERETERMTCTVNFLTKVDFLQRTYEMLGKENKFSGDIPPILRCRVATICRLSLETSRQP